LSTVERALVSVSKKDGLVDFVKGLSDLGIELVTTGGTGKILREAGIPVREISELTGFPEILGGRVKTLHPKVHGGLLAIRNNPEHRRQLRENEILPIDLVVVNLYPFEETIVAPGVSLEEVIENIDIGGPSMIRSAAKNFRDVAVVVDRCDYGWVLDELRRNQCSLSVVSRFGLAQKAFSITASYEAAIATYLSRIRYEGGRFQVGDETFPTKLYIGLNKISELRYGENPHQRAAFYREVSDFDAVLPDSEQLQGKELSFNNIVDLNSAYNLALEFQLPCAVIVKHNNPCGVAISELSQHDAYVKARACDPVSAFGSVLGFNKNVERQTAQEIALTFVEAVIAPGYEPEALGLLSSKRNLRLLKYRSAQTHLHPWDYKRVEGGMLVQEADRIRDDDPEWKIVTTRPPKDEEWSALRFAWQVVKHVKSNAIVYANATQTVGIGAGQMSRVDSARIGILKAVLPIPGCVMASDAFFPFRDGIDVAAEVGITAVVQPGGSMRDEEIVRAADEHGMAMVFTGRRHFKH